MGFSNDFMYVIGTALYKISLNPTSVTKLAGFINEGILDGTADDARVSSVRYGGLSYCLLGN